ncbi:MAG: tRNA ((37)-N6)-threonylcarbamoyltransferase complex dimerization subunit type 1 TsaB [Bacillota bacterium]|jgi:tRNA threonylcarbamoyladenosine biosynthesis protein TsaB
MIWLAMDTSTTTLTVAVLRDGELLAEHSDRAERNHSIRLVPAIEEILREAGVTKQQLNGIAVGHGPGSYTGVRIAATVAKTFAWSLGIPLVGVSSLAALALTAALEDGVDAADLYIPVMDARRGQAYTGLYGRTELPDGQPSMIALEQDANRLAEPWFAAMQTVKTWKVVGETDAFTSALQTTNAESKYVELRAYAIGLLGLERFAKGEQEEVHHFVPNYTQLAEAEVNWLAKQQG